MYCLQLIVSLLFKALIEQLDDCSTALASIMVNRTGVSLFHLSFFSH